ncbi:unnamed protein product [Caenorhabditis angaria]|uniref:Domain of unknown function DB domain-containing protein n=1 Tax=Caenorhabditis angaria TaxID=860376 RepID=A0A9P1IW41_9PELO|nr:unnamed protein product [Caenorhabditis angaria]
MQVFLVFLIFLNLNFVDSRYFCGLDGITNNWMEIQTKLDCPSILTHHQECCKTHGWCYVHKKKTLENCDAEYCLCVAKLAPDGVCKTQSDNFCNNVKMMGHMMWPIINENGMAV